VSAKDILLKPISRDVANECVKKFHYSGKVVNNSQLHIGVFWNGALEGAMQFGPSLDKSKIQGLVERTPWNGFLELNRMAFGPALPVNSESRALAVAMRIIKKNAPHIEWIISFADATQCGDGTIYRASGFLLTGIKKNNQVWAAPSGDVFSRVSLTEDRSAKQKSQAVKVVSRTTLTKGGNNFATGGASMKSYQDAGFRPLDGFQIRYIYPLKPDVRERLTVPILPYSALDDAGARMYKGQRVGSADSGTPSHHEGGGGANPTPTLLSDP
jgi:hypothetical protein